MQVVHSFVEDNIVKAFQNIYKHSVGNNVKFSVHNCDCNENFSVLNIYSDSVNQQKYVLFKIPNDIIINGQQNKTSSTVFYPEFIIENTYKETFGAFDKKIENFKPADKNNYTHLKLILKTLAEHQAKLLTINEQHPKTSEYGLKKIAENVLSLDFFNDFSNSQTDKEIERLENLATILLDSDLLVTSFSINNAFVKENSHECVLLDISTQKFRPPVYDALMFIFAHSDEKFRQKHFEEIVKFYFQTLVESLENLDSEKALRISKRSYNENQIRILLPVVKFELAQLLSVKYVQENTQLEEILIDIYYFLKYPLINKEDCLEVVNNKLGTPDYDFLSYQLKPLNEKNGHLGEYFHLSIKVKHNGENQEIELFAKFVVAHNDTLRVILESGPGKKEEFFYKTLLPMFAEHGIDSLIDFVPRCYLSRLNFVLVLDDMGRQGFIGLKPNSILDYNGLRLTVSNLAKLHASTMILEEILSRKEGRIVRLDEKYAEFFEECVLVYEEGHAFKKTYDRSREGDHYLIEKFPELTRNIKLSPEELKERVDRAFFTKFKKATKSNTVRNSICHGDMYVANMLFKFETGNVISKAYLVDFQMLRYCPPTHDLLFFLYLTSSKETRSKYLSQLTEEYYDELSTYIDKFGFNSKTVFSKEDYRESLKFMKSQALMQAIEYAQFTMLDPDFREEVFGDEEKFNYYANENRIELIDVAWKSESFRNVMKGLVQDLLELAENNEI